jgi:hypothetical protein
MERWMPWARSNSGWENSSMQMNANVQELWPWKRAYGMDSAKRRSKINTHPNA